MSIDEMTIDFRTVDVQDSDTQDFLKDTFDKMIKDGFTQMESEGMLDVWRLNEMYYEDFQVPLGASNDALGSWVRANNKMLRPDGITVHRDNEGKMYVVDNKIAPYVDGRVGMMAETKKELSVKPDDVMKNNNIEKAVKLYLEKIQNKKQFWENYFVPCLEGFEKLGLYWLWAQYDPTINAPQGDIQFRAIHPKDVAVDPGSRERKYFMDGRYVVYKERIALKEAKTYFSQFDIDPNEVVPDNDYEFTEYRTDFQENEIVKDEYVTVYHIRHKCVYMDEFNLAEHFGLEATQEDVLKEKRMYHFKAIYNKQLGCVYHAVDPYADPRDHDSWQFDLIPFYNKKSALRVYPISDVEKLLQLQDIDNILKSLFLNNTRDLQKIRPIIRAKIKDEFPDMYEAWIRGEAPLEIDDDMVPQGASLSSVIDFLEMPKIPKEVYDLVNIIESAFEDKSTRHEALRGEYPDQNLSGKAINLIQSADRQRQSYKETNVNWAMTQACRLIYKIMAREFTEDDYVEIQGARKGTAQYVPINAIMSYQEFYQFIAKAYPDVMMSENPMEAMHGAIQDFEKENDLQFQHTKFDEYGRPLPLAEIEANNSTVFINYLTDAESNEPYNLEIKCEFAFESEMQEQENKVLAMELRKSGDLSRIDMFKYIGGPFAENAEEYEENLKAEQEIMQYGTMVAENPQLKQLIQGVMMQPQQGVGTNG